MRCSYTPVLGSFSLGDDLYAIAVKHCCVVHYAATLENCRERSDRGQPIRAVRWHLGLWSILAIFEQFYELRVASRPVDAAHRHYARCIFTCSSTFIARTKAAKRTCGASDIEVYQDS